MQAQRFLAVITCANMRITPSTKATLDALCNSYCDSFAISTEVVAAGTENDSEREISKGIFITS